MKALLWIRYYDYYVAALLRNKLMDLLVWESEFYLRMADRYVKSAANCSDIRKRTEMADKASDIIHEKLPRVYRKYAVESRKLELTVAKAKKLIKQLEQV